MSSFFKKALTALTLVLLALAVAILFLKPEWKSAAIPCFVLGILGFTIGGVLDLDKEPAVAKTPVSFESNLGLYTLLILLSLLNFVFRKYEVVWDVTRQGIYTLQPATIERIEKIDSSVQMIGFFRQHTGEADRFERIAKLYAQKNPLIEYRSVDPDTDLALAKQYQVQSDGEVVLVQQDRHVTASSLDEGGLLIAFQRLLNPTRPTLCVSSGLGELDVSEKNGNGISRLASKLEQLGYALKTTLWNDRESLKECRLLFILAPEHAPQPLEFSALEELLDQKVSLWIGLSNSPPASLIEWIKTLGIEVDTTFLEDPINHPTGAPATTLVFGNYYGTPLQEKVKAPSFYPTVLGLSRTEATLEKAKKWIWEEIVPIAASTRRQGSDTPLRNIAIARGVAPTKDRGGIIVFGDSDFLTNANIDYHANAEVFAGLVSWSAPDSRALSLVLRAEDETRLHWSPETFEWIRRGLVYALPLGVFALCFGVWIKRRV